MQAPERFSRQHEELVRPETSKNSRSSSNRTNYNRTMVNFYTKELWEPKKDGHSVQKQESLQTPSRKIGNTATAMCPISDDILTLATNSKKLNFSVTNDRRLDKKKNPKKAMASSMGFKIEVNDIQEGATLDKVLGARFKKINIFNSREGDLFPLGDLKGDMKRKSANYMYENFEILETENEEEQPSQSRSSFRKQCSRNGERPLSSNKKNLFIESEISDKINKKYKNKLLTVSHQLSKLIGNINSFDDVQDKEEIVHTSETNSRDSGIKGNEDSTPLASTKFSVKRKDKGSNSQTSRKIKVYAGLSETFRDSNVDKERITKDNFNNQQKMAEHQGQHEDSNQFRASMKNFRKTMYTDRHKNGSVGNLSEKYDESRKTNLQGEAKSKLRASVANWNPLNGYTKVIERNNDIRYIFGTKTPQMRSTEINFHGEKPGQKKHSKHFSFTNNLITERIMQHEQELLDKYSHKKLLNQTERFHHRSTSMRA